MKQKEFYDYGPTLFMELLETDYNIKISKERVRYKMIEHNLRIPSSRKRRMYRKLRKRRSYE